MIVNIAVVILLSMSICKSEFRCWSVISSYDEAFVVTFSLCFGTVSYWCSARIEQTSAQRTAKNPEAFVWSLASFRISTPDLSPYAFFFLVEEKKDPKLNSLSHERYLKVLWILLLIRNAFHRWDSYATDPTSPSDEAH